MIYHKFKFKLTKFDAVLNAKTAGSAGVVKVKEMVKHKIRVIRVEYSVPTIYKVSKKCHLMLRVTPFNTGELKV